MGNPSQDHINFIKYSNEPKTPGYVFVIAGLVVLVVILGTMLILK